MAIVTVFLVMVFVLGVMLSPLFFAAGIAAFGDTRARKLGAKAIGLGLQSIYRPALTFNGRAELTLKRRAYDEEHDRQYVSFGGMLGGVKRFLYNPQERIHDFYGVPFAFVDELFGLVVDPRDVVVGRAFRKAQENDAYEHQVELHNGYYESVRAFFEIPRGPVGGQLTDVWRLIGGSFDSQVVDRIHEYYETSQAPKAETSALRQLLVPVGTFIAIVLMGVFVAGQQGGGGGAVRQAANESTINVGASSSLALLALTMPTLSSVRERITRDLFAFLGLSAMALAVAAGLVLIFSVPAVILGIPLPLGAWMIVALLLGAAVPPFVAVFLGRSLGPLGMLLGKLYIIIGLVAWSRPVITYADGQYKVYDYSDADEWYIEPKWYRFAMSRVGVGLANYEDNWPQGTVHHPDEVQQLADGTDEKSLADGGQSAAPVGYTPTDKIAVDNILGFVPEDVDETNVHVRTDRTTGWMLEAGQNSQLMLTALENAKKKFGGGIKPLGDKWIMIGTLLAMAFGAIFDYLVFFS